MEPAKLREALRKQGIYVHEGDPVLEIGAICQLAVADIAEAIRASLLKELRQEVTKAEAAARLSVRMVWLTGGISVVALAGVPGFWLAGL